MSDLQKKLVALSFIVFAIIFLSCNLPQLNEFRLGADEGNYYRHAREITVHGFSGLKNNATNYLNNPEFGNIVNPMRIIHLLLTAFALKFSDSIMSLAVYSMLCYITFLIISFYYIRKLWNLDMAVVTTILLAVSPLGLALARRALADSDYYLFSSLAIFSFIDYIYKPSNNKLYLFIFFLIISWLIRETTFFLFPFFIGYLLYDNILISKKINFKHIIITIFFPLIFILSIYFLIFGITDSISIMKVPYGGETGIPTGYGLYIQGSWYYYILGYFLLSPIITFFSFCFIGYTLLIQKADRKNMLLVLLFIYLFIPLGFVHKEVRYGINFDLFIRMFFAMFLISFYEKYKLVVKLYAKNILVIIVFLSIIFFDLKAFNNYFIVNQIYNPIMYNLMEAEHFIPSESDFATSNAIQNIQNTKVSKTYVVSEQITKLENQVKSDPSSDNYYSLALLYYSNKDFAKCIIANQKAIEIKPDFAEAYNNIAAAYGSLGDFEKEILACEQALKLKPDFQLAKNNLEWARAMLKQNKK